MRCTRFFACCLVLLFSSSLPALSQEALSGAVFQPRGPLPCVGGFAGPYPCRAVDQTGHVPLNDLSVAQFDGVRKVLGWRHEASDREFALVLGSRVSIVEVTNPEDPEMIGDYRVTGTGPSSLIDLEIYGDHLYTVVQTLVSPGQTSESRLEIFDLTRLLDEPGPSARFLADTSFGLDRGGSLSINPETGFAYVLSGGFFSAGQIVAFDLNHDPEAPEEVFDWNPGQPFPNSLDCVIYHGPDDRFEGHEICFGSAPRRSLVIFDVTDKDHPVKLARAFYRPFNQAFDVAVSADHRFVLLADSHDEYNPGGNTRTFLFDVSSLTAPVHFNTYQGPARSRDLDLEVRGRFAFLANARAGLRILDLRELSSRGRVREAGFFDVEPEKNSSDWFGARSVDILPSGIVIVGSVRQGLYVLRPRLPG